MGCSPYFPGILGKLQVRVLVPERDAPSAHDPSLSAFYFSPEKLEPTARSCLGQYIHQTELATKGKTEALRLGHSPYITAQSPNKN